MHKCTLVKWDGNPPTQRPSFAEIRERVRGVPLSHFFNPFAWRAIARHVFARVTPNPFGHPQVREILAWDEGHSPSVIYRRPE
jgi:hypothetical protein